MEPEKITVYAVYANSDLTEGRGREYVSMYTTSISHAHRVARNAYVQGSTAPVKEAVIWKFGNYYFDPGSKITISAPSNKDLLNDEFIVTYKGILNRAKELGLTEDEINTLQAGKTILK